MASTPLRHGAVSRGELDDVGTVRLLWRPDQRETRAPPRGKVSLDQAAARDGGAHSAPSDPEAICTDPGRCSPGARQLTPDR